MRLNSLLVVLFLVLPLSADALVRPPLSSTKCPAGQSSEAPAVSKMDLDRKTNQATAQKFLNTAFYCPNACYNLSASLTLTYTGVTVVVNAKDMCASKNELPSKQTPPRGCVKGQTEPQVTIATKDVYSRVMGFSIPDQVIQKSRCDENVIESSVSKFFDGLKQVETNAAAAQQQMQTALNDLRTGNDPRPNEPTLPVPSTASAPPEASDTTASPPPVVVPPQQTPSDNGALSKVLQDRFGIPADQADSLVQSDAEKIKAMIQKSMTNDTEGAQAIAKELRLNEDVINSIAQMTPPKQITPEEAQAAYDRQQADRQTTFDEPPQTSTGLPQQCGVEGLAGNIMLAESRCAQINSNPLSSVQGPYHFLCDTWRAYANSTGNGQYSDCAYRNDPTISTQVMNAKMDQFAQQYGSQCTQAGLSLSSCQYGIHVFGEAGFRRIYNAYLSNPNDSAYSLCGAALTTSACTNNISIFRNGGTIAGVFGELDRRLGGNGTIISSMAGNGSPFTGITGGLGSYTPSGSPFSGLNPLYSSLTGNSTPTGYSTSYGYQSGNSSSGGNNSWLSSMLSNLFGNSNQQRPVQAAPTQISYTDQPQRAIVTIIAQPQNTYRGNSVVVSWSSVGTRVDAPCTAYVLFNGSTTTLGNSNEGSKIMTATSSGILRFSVACVSLTGDALLQSTNVSVQ